MIRAYDECYTAKAQTCLGFMLRYAAEDLGYELNAFCDLFIRSGVAHLFGRGDFRFLVGMSGAEAAREVLWRTKGIWPETPPSFHTEKSPVYWTGWITAWYQWYTGLDFDRIFEQLKPDEICSMYIPYHEMDQLHFAREADRRIHDRLRATRLKAYRERLGLSQSGLAHASGVSVRMIQHYEQRQKDINEAHGSTLKKLADALHCRMEELMETDIEGRQEH